MLKRLPKSEIFGDPTTNKSSGAAFDFMYFISLSSKERPSSPALTIMFKNPFSKV